MDLIRAAVTSYAQVLFARDPWVGALLLGATLMDPRVGLHGGVAVGRLAGLELVGPEHGQGERRNPLPSLFQGPERERRPARIVPLAASGWGRAAA